MSFESWYNLFLDASFHFAGALCDLEFKVDSVGWLNLIEVGHLCTGQTCCGQTSCVIYVWRSMICTEFVSYIWVQLLSTHHALLVTPCSDYFHACQCHPSCRLLFFIQWCFAIYSITVTADAVQARVAHKSSRDCTHCATKSMHLVTFAFRPGK